MPQVLTTDVVTPRRRVAFWQEMVCQTFVQAHCDSELGEAFGATLSTEAFERTEISRIDAGPQRIHRRAVDIARACKPRFYLCYHAAGHARYRERHGESLLGPGDMILLDNCEPYCAEYQDSVTSYVLHVPHEVLRERFRLPERVLGRKLGGQGGLSRVTGDFLRSCLAQAGSLDAAQRPLLADMALNLFSSVLAEDVGQQPDLATHQAVLLLRIKRYVAAHLHEPDLDLARVAAAAGMSSRYVSRLFQLDGLSFGRYVLRQRIEHCQLALANPALRGLKVSQIALDAGFSNFAHFSRVFRECTGCTPSDYRARALDPSSRVPSKV